MDNFSPTMAFIRVDFPTFGFPMVGSGEHFALEIVGDSMVGAGILDGDTVVIQRAETARHGEIVVALINQQEATLKTLLKEPGRVGLEAANPRYETRYFSTGEVEVQGMVRNRFQAGGFKKYVDTHRGRMSRWSQPRCRG